MKKLIMLAAAVAFVGISQAAMIDWKIAKNATKNYAGTATAMKVYLLTEAQWNAVKDSVAANGEAALTSGTYLMADMSSTSAAVSNEKITVSGANAGDSINFYSLIFDTNGGKDYYKYASAQQSVYDPNDAYYSTAKTYQTAALTLNQATWTEAGGAVPEPTSGLLLMVGLGALALRRRKA